MFAEWWSNLSNLHQILYIIAIPSTAILVLQTILLLFGLGGNNDGDISHDHDLDLDGGGIDLDGDGIPDAPSGFVAHDHVYDQGADHDIGVRLFTVRGIIAFLVMGSWTAIAALDLGAHIAIAAVLGLLVGAIAMLLIGIFFKASMRLQQSGNLDVNNAVGGIAEVYLTIPPAGKGKVTLIIQDRLTEMDAVSADGVDRPLKNGENVVVKSITNNILTVAPISHDKST